MSIRFHIVRDYETYFKTLKNADWEKQYLTSNGELRSKCCCSIFSIFLRIVKVSFIRVFVSPNIYQARVHIRNRIELYYMMPGKTITDLDCIVGSCKKVNELINKINGRRPDNGLEVLPDKLRFNIEKHKTFEALHAVKLQEKQQKNAQNDSQMSSKANLSSSSNMPELFANQLPAWGMSGNTL